VLWLVIAVVLFSVFEGFNKQSAGNTLNYSDFISSVRDDRVQEVTIDGLVIEGIYKDNTTFKSIRPNLQDPKLIDDLYNHNVVIKGREVEQPSLLNQLLVASFPILIIIAVFWFFMRQMQGGAGGKGGPMSFGKSKARLLR
jgi:cell division protease FtsH